MDRLADVDRERLAYLEQRVEDADDASKDLFHRANNALFIMTVNLELLTRFFKLNTACNHEDAEKYLALFRQKIEEIAVINRRFLNVDKDGPLYVVHSFVSFRAIILRAIEIYTEVAAAKNITISWTLPDFPAVAIWTDGVAIATVLDNLLSNAVKFSPPGNHIWVSMTREQQSLVCVVCDHGPGLSEKELADVFKRGVQLGPKPTAGETSSGHGLAIAKNLAETLGGWLRCESVEGEGTTFLFSLPTTTAASTAVA